MLPQEDPGITKAAAMTHPLQHLAHCKSMQCQRVKCAPSSVNDGAALSTKIAARYSCPPALEAAMAAKQPKARLVGANALACFLSAMNPNGGGLVIALQQRLCPILPVRQADI